MDDEGRAGKYTEIWKSCKSYLHSGETVVLDFVRACEGRLKKQALMLVLRSVSKQPTSESARAFNTVKVDEAPAIAHVSPPDNLERVVSVEAVGVEIADALVYEGT